MAGRATRRTSPLTRAIDRAATTVITVGGLSVVAAMLGICLFLLASAAPLLRGGDVTGRVGAAATEGDGADAGAAVLLVPGPRGIVVTVSGGGVARAVDARTGETLAERSLFDGEGDGDVASVVREPGTGRITAAAGSAVLSGVLEVERTNLRLEEVPEGLRGLAAGARRRLDGAFGERFDAGSWFAMSEEGEAEVWTLAFDASGAIELAGAVASADVREVSSRRRSAVAMLEGGGGVHASIRVSRALGGAGERLAVTTTPIDLPPGDPPRWLFAWGEEGALAVWPRGTLERFEPRDGALRAVDHAELGSGAGEIAAAALALGGESLLLGTSRGEVQTWTVVPGPDRIGAESSGRLRAARRVRAGPAAVVSLSPGDRDRTVAVGLADGSAAMINMTSGKRVAMFGPAAGGEAAHVAASPSLDRLAVLGRAGPEGSGLEVFAVEPGHPEASFSSLFGRVQYEGYERPRFVYQSTGTEGSEPKLSLTPLIWGTLKATLVAMLIAAPLGVLAALYSSEFLHPSVRRTVKPTIELMASLPSVVLGFVAAIVVAPFVRRHLAEVLTGAALLPLGVLLAAHLWRLVPAEADRRVGGAARLGLVLAVLAGSTLAAVVVAPPLEDALFRPTAEERLVGAGSYEVLPRSAWPVWARDRLGFDDGETRRLRAAGFGVIDGELVRPVPGAALPPVEGELRGWLDGGYGAAWPGWLVALLPAAAVLAVLLDLLALGTRWTAWSDGLGRGASARLALVRFAAVLAGTLALAAGGAAVLSGVGLDPRDSVFGPFSQRNTLVVGFVMGFAVIPIIYSISEDALRSVPDSLRSASLGAGATPWQTAVRVVLPVAGSGVFSACMVGLGRAVGETMIVLMATGNTPEMTGNIFGGFRTLAANIAVELPEAPRGGTHYRVLFLCGLVLFLMTLVVNTTAEVVRQRFRAKSRAI